MKRDTIRGQDVVFVVAAVLCELYTASRLFSYIFTITFHRGSDGLCTVCGQPEDEHHGREKRCYPNKARSAGDVEVTTLSLLADVGFSVGKLFPLAYSCEDPACAKITHNCVMTLSCWVFAALECAMLHQMVLNLREDGGKSRAAAVKLLELALCLAYVLYDLAPLAHSWSNADTFGVSTIVLIVLTCLAEVLLMAFEVYTICQACSWKKRGVHVHPGDRLVQDDVHELEALPSGQPA
jgi:hypothetical protein